MRVVLQYFAGCPNWQRTEQLVRQALDQLGLPPDVLELQDVPTAERAEEVGFRGSPTVLVDGHDPFAQLGAPVGLSCRVFATPDGLAGAPTLEQLVAALDHREA